MIHGCVWGARAASGAPLAASEQSQAVRAAAVAARLHARLTDLNGGP